MPVWLTANIVRIDCGQAAWISCSLCKSPMEHVERAKHVVTEALMVAEFAAVHWQRKSVSAQPVVATAVEKQARYRPMLGQLSRECLG